MNCGFRIAYIKRAPMYRALRNGRWKNCGLLLEIFPENKNTPLNVCQRGV